MDNGDGLTVVIDRILDCCTNQPLGTLTRNRLHTDTGCFREPDLGNTHLFLQEFDDLFHFIRPCRPLDTGIDIFGVLTEDHHINILRTFYR